MVLMLLIGIGVMAGGPFLMSMMVDSIVRKSTVENLEIKQLNFTKALVVTGRVRNSGKIDLKNCIVDIQIWKQDNNEYKEYKRMFKKPTYSHKYNVAKFLPQRRAQEFKAVYDNFRVPDGYEVVVKSKCE
jgi:hypothetical protein